MSIFDSILASIPQQKAVTSSSRLTMPICEAPVKACTSAPLPFGEKADLNKKQGIITSYLTKYKDPTTGTDFIDSYRDVCDVGFMSKTISDLNQTRKRTNSPYLCLYLWQHKREEPIGGIKSLTEDSHGVIYEAQVNMSLQRGREAFSMVENQYPVGSSYGYDATKFWFEDLQKGLFDEGDRIRHLKEVVLHECSIVSFAANPHANFLDAKSRFYVPSLPYQNNKLAALTTQMNQALDAVESKLNSMHSSFPSLPGDDYIGASETDITNLLAQIQLDMR